MFDVPSQAPSESVSIYELLRPQRSLQLHRQQVQACNLLLPRDQLLDIPLHSQDPPVQKAASRRVRHQPHNGAAGERRGVVVQGGRPKGRRDDGGVVHAGVDRDGEQRVRIGGGEGGRVLDDGRFGHGVGG